MRVLELRRYPVKAMGGESLASVLLDARGLVADRWFAVEDDDGHFASGKDTRRFRRHDEVFEYAASSVDGQVVVRHGERSWTVGDRALDDELSERMGTPVRVLPEADVPHFDDGQLSLIGTASLDWCREQLGVDTDWRRLRPNIVLETAEPFVEESWIGQVVQVGAVQLRVVSRIERCRTVDLAQNGVTDTTRLLKALGRSRNVCLGVYADVVAPGPVRIGDAAVPVRAGWWAGRSRAG
ncbi:MAG TPA: MOSC domain-containing protein [Candidatus Limnocylindria bacterium]|nr:MOSC domain-containing protein [Candidatus Limnocylindria bacterium]